MHIIFKKLLNLIGLVAINFLITDTHALTYTYVYMYECLYACIMYKIYIYCLCNTEEKGICFIKVLIVSKFYENNITYYKVLCCF